MTASVKDHKKLNDMMKNMLLLAKQMDTGRKASNNGGYQTHTHMFSHLPDLIDQAAKTHNDGTQKLLFKATAEHARMLHDIILGATHEYVKKTHKKYKKEDVLVRITAAWLAENKHSDYNAWHIHPGNQLSGVYYISDGLSEDDRRNLKAQLKQQKQNKKASSHLSGQAGCFVVKDPRQEAYFHQFGSRYGCSSRYYIRPTAGSLLLFPTWLQHGVRPHPGHEGRAMMSFNIEVDFKSYVHEKFVPVAAGTAQPAPNLEFFTKDFPNKMFRGGRKGVTMSWGALTDQLTQVQHATPWHTELSRVVLTDLEDVLKRARANQLEARAAAAAGGGGGGDGDDKSVPETALSSTEEFRASLQCSVDVYVCRVQNAVHDSVQGTRLKHSAPPVSRGQCSASCKAMREESVWGIVAVEEVHISGNNWTTLESRFDHSADLLGVLVGPEGWSGGLSVSDPRHALKTWVYGDRSSTRLLSGKQLKRNSITLFPSFVSASMLTSSTTSRATLLNIWLKPRTTQAAEPEQDFEEHFEL
eukprot:CAMPEP_0175129558 /NCGR_PEP_ID=MMETSP0087-20121206/5537_1 /TAXON_ID=136419 /ORGANISM="Unknown Unknown, Strain D1" /LENGTH=527 /DNA_ID=CAMNT_0016411717 /DNA_START=95 /DNA_END=1678 /DNA_ORIENTATION=+